jgi:hypothetical protein
MLFLFVFLLGSLLIGYGTCEVRGDKTGYFELNNLPHGQYCFFASASRIGWNGAFGIIIIDKKANRKNEIEIELAVGGPSSASY